MYGKNPIEKNENTGTGLELRVVKGSPFLTVQGEGPYAGRSAIFVRLHGCNLRCTFCDTQFSDPDDPLVSCDDLISKIVLLHSDLVVITGGEPMRQNILPLCKFLSSGGYVVQIETAGTLWIDGIEQYADIVVSPKTPTIHAMITKHAVAFKYVIDIRQTFDGFIPITATQPGTHPHRLALPRNGAKVYLSPMDTGKEIHNALNRQLVGSLAMNNPGTIAGLQLHKFMELD